MSIDYTTLLQLSFQCDLDSFLAHWEYTLMAVSKPPPDELLYALLVLQLR